MPTRLYLAGVPGEWKPAMRWKRTLIFALAAAGATARQAATATARVRLRFESILRSPLPRNRPVPVLYGSVYRGTSPAPARKRAGGVAGLAARTADGRDGRLGGGKGLRRHDGGQRDRARRRVAQDLLRALQRQGGVLPRRLRPRRSGHLRGDDRGGGGTQGLARDPRRRAHH